jgi:group I intron endonuclease
MHIYKFTHIDTGRSYIGQTIQDPNQRRLEHISDSRHTSKEYHFHNAIRKYGIDAFTFDVIDTAVTLEQLNLLEEKYVAQYDSINNGFNIRQAGGNKLHSEQSKQRMSEAQRAAHARRKTLGTDTWQRADGGAMKGKQQTAEAREKQRLAHLQSTHCRGKTWKLVDGKRTWITKEASV